MIDMNGHIKIIGIRVALRVEALHVVVRVAVTDFCFAFLYIQVTARYIRERKHIRIGFGDVARRGYHEFSRVFIQKHLDIPAQRSGRLKRADCLFVRLPIRKLFLDLLNGTLFSLRKPWRKLRRAILAEVSVL